MIASTQLANIKIFAFIAVQDFKVLRVKVFFINRNY